MTRFFILILICLCLYNCKSEDKSEKNNTAVAKTELSKDSKIFLGNRLFSEKTCITCHAIDRKDTGPSVKEIVAIYTKEDASIIDFLKGKTKPIVDTNPIQVAMMKANINGFLKNVTDVELDAIVTYMYHVDDLNP